MATEIIWAPQNGTYRPRDKNKQRIFKAVSMERANPEQGQVLAFPTWLGDTKITRRIFGDISMQIKAVVQYHSLSCWTHNSKKQRRWKRDSKSFSSSYYSCLSGHQKGRNKKKTRKMKMVSRSWPNRLLDDVAAAGKTSRTYSVFHNGSDFSTTKRGGTSLIRCVRDIRFGLFGLLVQGSDHKRIRRAFGGGRDGASSLKEKQRWS